MTLILISTEGGGEAALANLERLGEDLGAAWRRIIERFRFWIREEFAQRAGFTASGRLASWPAVRAFGNQQPPAQPLRRSGLLFESWQGRGAGAVEEVGRLTARFGVRGIPYAAVQRGTNRSQITIGESLSATEIKVTPKMRRFLGLVKGVWLKSSTTVIRVPARPHAGFHPRLRTEATAILVSHVTGRPTPFEAGA